MSEVNIHRPSEPVITVSKAAKDYFLEQLEKRGHGLGVRLWVKTSGCSGYLYQLDFIDESKEDDKVFLIDNVLTIYVDPESLAFVAGTELDYVTEGLSSKVVYHNPRAEGICGCGESFNIKD